MYRTYFVEDNSSHTLMCRLNGSWCDHPCLNHSLHLGLILELSSLNCQWAIQVTVIDNTCMHHGHVRVCRFSITVVVMILRGMCSVSCTLAYSFNFPGKTVCECERAGVLGLRAGRPARARVSESLRMSGLLVWAYIPQLFLTTHPLLITALPPPDHSGSTFGSFFLLTRGQIQTE